MSQGIKGSLGAAEGQLRADLLARHDNPYVDVTRLQAVLDTEQAARAQLLNGAQAAPGRIRLGSPMGAGSGRWLAFVNPQAAAGLF
jgi:DNA-binding transcriptional LysR family regulator